MVTAPFIEQDCTITHEGKSFTASGSWLAERADKPGTWAGVVYVREGVLRNGSISICHSVGTWHGDFIAVCDLGDIYRGNYCRMRTVSFTHNGINFHGRYCPDTSQAVRVTGRKAKAKAK